MNRYYYEVIITPNRYKEEIESFLMDHFYNGIEEVEGSLILRSEEPLDDIVKKSKEYANALSKIFNEEVRLDIEIKKKRNLDWIENYKKSIKPVEVGEF